MSSSREGDITFVASEEDIYVLRRGAPLPERVHVEASEPGWRVAHLLAIERRADSPRLLALMHRGHRHAALWWLNLEGRRARAVPVAIDEMFRDAPTFFVDLFVPRCADGPRDCLVVLRGGTGASALGIEPQRGAAVSTVKELDGLQVLDAVWRGERSGEIGLLVARSCP